MDITPSDVAVFMQRGHAAFAQGDLVAAEDQFRAALAAGATGADLHHHLGYLARARGDIDEAAARYAEALEHAPDDAHLLNNLGEVRRVQGLMEEAEALFRRARELAPDEAPIAANLGSLLVFRDRPDLALPHLGHAVAIDPSLIEVRGNIAMCLCSLNRFAEAIVVYRRMYDLVPSHNDARYLEALALLALGDFANGWRKHEVRWYAQLGHSLRRAVPGPYWRGEDDLAGRAILVHAEQGHGDTIQFLRYIPMLRQRAARVILEVQPGLKPVLGDLPDVFAREESLPPYDFHCSFMSLPLAFRTSLDKIPAEVPYLTVPADRLGRWRERLGAPDGRRRVGFAWSGTSTVWNRAVPLTLLEPLFARDDSAFHVIQIGLGPDDRATLLRLPHVIDHSTELGDFADTAALVGLMDLIISVDTVLVHLGGALAKPTWAMLPFGADYRWLTSGTSTPWYPTMRLFRQPALFDWSSVVDAIEGALSDQSLR